MVRVMRRDECGGDNCPGDTTRKSKVDVPSSERRLGGVICSNPIHYKKPMGTSTALAELNKFRVTDRSKLDDFRMKASA